MNNKFFVSLKYRLIVPVAILIIVGSCAIGTLVYFHSQRIHDTDAISIIDRQSMILEVIKTSMNAALDGSENAIKTVESNMDVLDESLIRLRDGGIIEYGFDQIDLVSTTDKKITANIVNMKNRWNDFERDLKELIASFLYPVPMNNYRLWFIQNPFLSFGGLPVRNDESRALQEYNLQNHIVAH